MTSITIYESLNPNYLHLRIGATTSISQREEPATEFSLVSKLTEPIGIPGFYRSKNTRV
jgi:hypothetical protein